MDADEKKVTIKKAANLMGTSEQFVRIGLRNNRVPFGSAVKLSSKWIHYISPRLFYQYIDNKKEQSRTINCISGT